MQAPIRIGAVAYDPRVVTIWEGMKDYFYQAGVPIDYVLFSNYEAQVDALFARQINIAWNTNVAYVRCEQRTGGRCQVLGMRNSDVGFASRLIARIDSDVKDITDLRGKRLAVGSKDSAQASILPLYYIANTGLAPERDFQVRSFDRDLGKHGDTGTSELDVLRALHDNEADAGVIGHVTWLRELEAGHINTSLMTSVWISPIYCHCNFTALPDFDPELAQRWMVALLRMDYNDPRWRHVMDLEGVTAWLPGQKEGYEDLARALSA